MSSFVGDELETLDVHFPNDLVRCFGMLRVDVFVDVVDFVVVVHYVVIVVGVVDVRSQRCAQLCEKQ